MAVDPTKTRKVLVVHGVQLGEDADQHQDRDIDQLIRNRIGGIPLAYEVEIYRYENINDAAQARLRQAVGLIAGTPVHGALAKKAIDLVGDVVIALADGSTAARIRQGLRDKLLEIYKAGNPCYLVAHSLGSIYAFDAVNALIDTKGYFKRSSRRTWPVQGLVTLGSPIGLEMFGKNRKAVTALGGGAKWFRWVNYWDRTDPVVSGEIFGTQLNGYRIAEQYLRPDAKQGWAIHDRAVDTGKLWLMAHVAYWDNPTVGDGLVDMITN